jgi:hypothetical protein
MAWSMSEQYLRFLGMIGEVIGSIPATFFGVIAGSFFSLGGVIITNRASEARLRKQFEHDQQLRVDEREHALRREVYLTAVEALVSSVAALGQFVNLNLPAEEASKGVTDKMPLLAKVNMIGGQDVVEGVIRLNTEIGLTVQNLNLRRIPLAAIKLQLDVLDVQLGRWGSDRDKSIEMMKSHNLSGIVDQKRFDTISNQHASEVKQFNETLERRTALQRTLFDQQLEYGRGCIKMIHDLRPLFVPVFLKLRKELGLPLDEAAFAKLADESSKRQLAGFESFLDEVRKQITTP